MDRRVLKGMACGLVVGILILSGVAAVLAKEEAFVDCGKLVFSQFCDISTMDPAEAFVHFSCNITRSAYEGLLQYDIRDFSIKPLLAESWELSEDGGIFRLKKGVKFHDGTEFNAAAVKFSFNRIMAINKGPATWVRDIKDVQIMDDYTIRIVTKKKWAFFLDVLAAPSMFMIVSPTEFKKHATTEDPWAAKWAQGHTCGTGPYMAAEWVPNQYVKMVRNENYWRGWSGKHFSEAVHQVNKEDSTERMLITRGAIDFLNLMGQEYWDVLRKDPNINVKVYASWAEQFFLMNNARGPLTDKNLRLAITHAIDYDACRSVMSAPKGNLMVGRVYERDLKKAMDYKNKSSYAGKEVTLTFTYGAGLDDQRKLALIVQDNLREIGVKLDLKQQTWPVMADQIYGNKVDAGDMYVFYSACMVADPYGTIYKVLHSNSIKPGGANLGYSDPKVDALLDEAAETLDKKKRMALYENVNRLASENGTYIWLYMYPFVVINRKNIKAHPYTQLGDALMNMFYFYDMYRE